MSHRTLKLYVDSTSLPLAHQMADLCACATDPDVIKLITWLRLPLDPGLLAPYQAHYLPELAAVSARFVQTVVQITRQFAVGRIELHSNHYHAWRGVAPLLRALQPLMHERRIALQLHLYDDGSIGPISREAHVAKPGALEGARAAAEILARHIDQGEPIEWTPDVNHAWHHCWPTRYHWLRPDMLTHTPSGKAWLEQFGDTVEPLAFDGFPQLDEPAVARFLQLFGLDGAPGEELAELAAAPDTLLFTSSGTWDAQWQQRLIESQLAGIAAMRASGVLESVGTIAFKPHPANLDGSERLRDALSADGGPRIVTLPPRIPLEVLLMAGLLPRQLVGVLSSYMANIERERIAAVLCRHPDTALAAVEQPYIDWLVRAGQLDPRQLVPVLFDS